MIIYLQRYYIILYINIARKLKRNIQNPCKFYFKAELPTTMVSVRKTQIRKRNVQTYMKIFLSFCYYNNRKKYIKENKSKRIFTFLLTPHTTHYINNSIVEYQTEVKSNVPMLSENHIVFYMNLDRLFFYLHFSIYDNFSFSFDKRNIFNLYVVIVKKAFGNATLILRKSNLNLE